MKYREVIMSKTFPALNDVDMGKFLYELANLEFVSPSLFNGQIVDAEGKTVEDLMGTYFFLGWKWGGSYMHDVAKKWLTPDPDFVAFVKDTVERLCLVPYGSGPEQQAQYEEAMKDRCSMVKTPSGQYAFHAQIGFEAWCHAHNKVNNYGKQHKGNGGNRQDDTTSSNAGADAATVAG